MKGRAKVEFDKISLLFWRKTHGLEEVFVDVAVCGFILSCKPPEGDIVLLVFL